MVLPWAPAVAAQEVPPEEPASEPVSAEPVTEPADEFDEFGDEEAIVITGARPRGSVVGDIPAENVLTGRDIRATGATDINELLEALAPQIGSARGRGGERPILLLNGQRISSFRELRDIPTEAIERTEILPEEVALKYGYRADQRVVNIVLRERFRSTAARVEGRMPTAGGLVGGLGDVTRLMIGRDSRTSVNLRADASGALLESERDIALAEGEVDQSEARTLVGSRQQYRGTVTHNRQVLGDVSATFNGELERSTGQSLLGFPLAGGVPDATLDPRGRDTRTDSAHLGAVFNGQEDKWRWSLTGNADLSRSLTWTDRSDSESSTPDDRSRSTRKSGELDATANGPLFVLPAGDVSATLKAGVSTLGLDTSRRRTGVVVENDLSRTQGNAAANLDLPVSRRNRDFDALGNLTLNANAEIQQLSDFGSLTSVGAGFNWSPVERLNFIGSWTREEGAPSIQQLGDPILETPDSRVFDFTRGETVLVSAVTGGNPDLNADRRDVMKLGFNWRPFTETDLRLRADYVRSRLDRPISSFPGPSEALEAAFPERFERNPDGQLVRIDLRPVNYDEARRATFRWGFDFSKQLTSQRPSREQIEQLRARARAAGVKVPERPPQAQGEAGSPTSQAGSGRRGGGGFGRSGGGGRRGGRLTFSLTHSINLVDEVTIRPGVPELDYLDGDAFGSSGGRPRHEVEAQAGYFNNGLGARLSANWRSGTRVDSAQGGELDFSPFAKFDLRLFANPGERFELVTKHPWLRGTQVRLEVRNVFDARQRVRDAAGITPLGYQGDLLDPQGRTISLSIRKLFLPPSRSFRRQRAQD